MLTDQLCEKITRYLKTDLVKNALSLKDEFKVTFLAQGEYNMNFLVHCDNIKLVFRVNTGSQLGLEKQITYEYDALKSLEKSGVTPKVYLLDDSKIVFDGGILVEEFLPGKPLNYKTDLKKAANIFSKIHGLEINEKDKSNFKIETDLFNQRILEGKNLLKDYFISNKPSREQKQFFYKFLDWCEKNKNGEKYFKDNPWNVINNTEVNSHNFLINGDKSYLIDWEKPVISDPCQDLTQFLAPTTTLWKSNYRLTEDEKERFYRQYEEGLKGPYKDIRYRVQLYTPYLYLRALSWCAYAQNEYEKEDRLIKNKDTLIKVKEYLDIDFMKNLLKGWFNG